jgi:hypothetical protein
MQAHLAGIHDALHAGDVELAHARLHRAIEGSQPPAVGVRDVESMPFDVAFRSLCEKHMVTASFVLAKTMPKEQWTESGANATLCTGGDAQLCGLLDKVLGSSSLVEKPKQERPPEVAFGQPVR